MFERPYQNAEPVMLDEDQCAVARRELKEMMSALGYLAQLLEPGKPVDRELAYNILYVSESRLAEVGKLAGVETDSAVERERRHAGIRAANERVRELERQLGGTMTAEQTAQSVARLTRKLQSWWRNEGLGHVRSAAIDSCGHMTVALSCMLFGNTALTQSSTPVSDAAKREAWLRSLTDRGFVLHPGSGSIGNLVDCDSSRTALVSLVAGAIPSAQFQGTEAQCSRKDTLVMREIRFYVTNLDDIEALPDSVE